MTRAAICVMGADPFLDAYWLRNFASWSRHVNDLYVVACGLEGAALQAVLEAALLLADDFGFVHFERVPAGTDHGVAIHRVIEHVGSDIVMLCEEDAYVRKPEAVGEMFRRIEAGETDLIGGPRGTLTPAIRDWANGRFGELVAQSGEAGPILWPCFLWAKREDLERTDRHYGAIGWQPGTPVLGQTFSEPQSADTFGWATLQLRELGLRVHAEAQYRADLGAMPGWSDPPWFHVGGLSTGWGVYLMASGLHDPAAQRGQDLTDWTKRAAWWRLMAQRAPGPEHLRARYSADIEALVAAMGMDEGQIAQWSAQFERLWPST